MDVSCLVQYSHEEWVCVMESELWQGQEVDYEEEPQDPPPCLDAFNIRGKGKGKPKGKGKGKGKYGGGAGKGSAQAWVGRRECHNCLVKGHIARDCPKPRVQRAGARGVAGSKPGAELQVSAGRPLVLASFSIEKQREHTGSCEADLTLSGVPCP